MVPTAFDEENGVLDRPPGMSDDECGPLSVWRGMMGKSPVVISCWKPTTEEMEEIKRTGRVWLLVVGESMPPIAPIGISPFVNRERE